jgi:hypothetical protein
VNECALPSHLRSIGTKETDAAQLVTERASSAPGGRVRRVALGFGHHPPWSFVDHVTVIRDALRQLPGHWSGRRAGRKVLTHIAGAGATHEVLDWVVSQRLSHSVGSGLAGGGVVDLGDVAAGELD